MSIVGKDITQDIVIEALETTLRQESAAREPNRARKQCRVDDEIGEYYEEDAYYGQDDDVEFDDGYEQEYWAEVGDESWHDCEEAYYQRDTATMQDFDVS
eukprot:2759617-Pyramimonas_sp.AAC.1